MYPFCNDNTQYLIIFKVSKYFYIQIIYLEKLLQGFCLKHKINFSISLHHLTFPMYALVEGPWDVSKLC